MGWCFTRAKLISMPAISLKATDPVPATSDSGIRRRRTAGTACRNYYGGSAMLQHSDIPQASV